MSETFERKPRADQNPGRMHQQESDAVMIDEPIDISRHWHIVKKGKWGILSVTLLFLIIGALVAARAVPVYQANVKVVADPQRANANGSELYVASTLVFLFYETQYEVIRSRNIAERVVDKLGLVDRYRRAQQRSTTEESPGLTATLKGLKTELASLFGNAAEAVQPPSDADLRISLASNIQRNLKVSGGTQSQVINISYSSPDPRQAADIVNAVAETYIQFGLETRLKEVKETGAWLSEQYTQLRTKLQDSEAALSDYRSQQGLVDTSQQERLIDNQLLGLNSELIRAQSDLSQAEEQYFAVQSVDVASDNVYSLGPVLQSAAARQMVLERAQLSQKVDELTERYGEKHPQMIAARSELKSATASLQSEVNKVIQNVEENYQQAKLRVDNIDKRIAEGKEEIQGLQGSRFSLITLEREVENNRRIYENFQVSLTEANVNSEYKGSNVQIIDRATVPGAPINNNKSLVAMAGMLGLVLGIAMTFVREMLDNTFKTPDDIESRLAMPALGITPLVKQNGNVVAPEKQYLMDPRSPFAESINAIRTGLLLSNIDNPPKTILVTSATGSEGKSTLALNLAAAFSTLGSTLLLEVDLRKPSLARNFGLDTRKGLTDLIGSPGNIEDNITHFMQKQRKELVVISCGTLPVNPLEMLSSQKFDAILDALKRHFDYVILDGPPTLPVSDSCILGTKVDAVVFTVKAEDTKIKVAREAVARLRQLHANVIGAVLTIAEPRKMSYYGEHYYSAQYYGSEASTPQDDAGGRVSAKPIQSL